MMLLVSSVQQSDSVTHTHISILFQILSQPFQDLLFVGFSMTSPSDQCEVALQCSFDLYFSNN